MGIGRPGVLQFMGSQGVRHDWATELNWMGTIFIYLINHLLPITSLISDHIWGIIFPVPLFMLLIILIMVLYTKFYHLNYKESWAQKNGCFWTVVLEKTLESPLDCKEIQPVHPKGDQSWVFIGRTDVEAETPILWPPDVKIWLIWKDPDAGKDWGQEEKGTTEDEMVGWHNQLNGHEFG